MPLNTKTTIKTEVTTIIHARILRIVSSFIVFFPQETKNKTYTKLMTTNTANMQTVSVLILNSYYYNFKIPISLLLIE